MKITRGRLHTVGQPIQYRRLVPKNKEAMTETIVELREVSSEGRLYCNTSPGSKRNLLIVESLQPRHMGYAVSIDGGLLNLYFDKERRLQLIELVFPRKQWEKLPNLSFPEAAEAADVFLRGLQTFHGKWKHACVRKRPHVTIRWYWSERNVTAVTNSDLSAVQIMIGSPEKSSRWITLSEECWAQVARNRLKGFFVKVSD